MTTPSARPGFASRALLWLAVLSFAQTADASAPAPGAEPAYVARGRQTEARQRAFKERLERLSQRLFDALRRGAPDLLAALEPPPPKIFGYRIVPRVVSDVPPPPPTKPQVVSFSWRWSDMQIEREMAGLDRLEADLAKIPPPPATADRAAYEALAADYRTAVDRSRPIASDVDYNWHWQRQIAGDQPPRFDCITAGLDAALARQKVTDAVASPSGTENAGDPFSSLRRPFPWTDRHASR